MKKVLMLLIAASFLITGCASVDVYTFKKDRVDQKETGNKGYLKGNAPETAQDKETPQRTMIGVDIELPGGSADSRDEDRFKQGGKIPAAPERAEAVPAKETKKKEVKPAAPAEKKSAPAQQVQETVVVETVEVETEEDWIK